jgi:hypothetical protein
MDDQDDAEMEQRLINEGTTDRRFQSILCVATILTLRRVQDMEEE